MLTPTPCSVPLGSVGLIRPPARRAQSPLGSAALTPPPLCPVSPGVHCAHPPTPCSVPPGSAVLTPMLGPRPRGPWCLPQCSVPPGSAVLTAYARSPGVCGAYTPPLMLSLPRVGEAHTCAQSLQGRWCSPPKCLVPLGSGIPPRPVLSPHKSTVQGWRRRCRWEHPHGVGQVSAQTRSPHCHGQDTHGQGLSGDRRWGSPAVRAS